MIPDTQKMLVLDFVYGTAASMVVPGGYSLQLINRKPPLETFSQATTTSMPDKRMQATVFMAVRLFLRRSAAAVEIGLGGGNLWDSAAGAAPGSRQILGELQILQKRIDSLVTRKISNSISVKEWLRAVWHRLHWSSTDIASGDGGNGMCHRLADGSMKANP